MKNFISLLPDDNYRQFKRIQNLILNKEASLDLFYSKNSWMPIWTKINGNSIFHYRDKTTHIKHYSQIFNNEIPRTFKGKIIFDYFRKLMLGDYMRKLDMMSMLNGVEWRVPFLDEDLVEIALSVPYNQKSNFFSGKKHTKSLHRMVYPKSTTNFPKHGFSIPLSNYLSLDSRRAINEKILKKDTYVSQFIRRDYIKYLTNQFLEYSDKKQISYEAVYQRILILYALENWHEGI